MNIIETLSLRCGSKIDKPYIYSAFFPIPMEKYITFHASNFGGAKDYGLYQDVINIINPILSKHNISLVQLGDPKDHEYSGCINLKGQININQSAYVIKNSLLHFGCEGFLIHLAAGFNIPLVSIFSNNYINCDKPTFGESSKQIFLSSYDRLGLKPSFSNDENPKTINLIKPEEIASGIFKLLKIDFDIPFETLYCGKKYTNFNLQESIPNHSALLFNPELPVEIRTDNPEYDQIHFFNQLARYKKSVIVIEKPININILKQLKHNISMLVYKVTENDYDFFLEELKSIGCKLILFSELSDEKINPLKIKYYTINIINKPERPTPEKVEELRKNLDNLYYRSSKITASKGKFYYSPSAVKLDIPLSNPFDYQKVIDEPEFWNNLEFFTIIRKK